MFNYYTVGNNSPGVATGVQWPSSTPTTAPTIIPPAAAALPDLSLKGQTWGWPIPITAGLRTIPGRPVWRRIRKGATTYFMDVAVSFGWRAEIMADDPGVTLAMNRLLANGIVLQDAATGVTAPGVTCTFYDGTQTTADPFLVSVDGADDVQAFVFHIYAVVQNVPLLQFGNMQPDAWALDVADSGPAMTLPRAYTLLADLTRDMKGRVTVAANITEAIDSLFIVESGSFNSMALSIGRLCDCDMRESNHGVEIVRAADGAVDAALTESVLLRASGESGLTFTRIGDDNLPAEIRAQFVASEATFKFSERPARRDFGPLPTTSSTRVDTVRVPLGMTVNQAQTYVSGCLYRETEARDSVDYALPWGYAVKAQPGDIHTVPDGDDLLTVKVARADLDANRTVKIQARRLHTTLDYAGQAIVGDSLPSFVAVPTYQATLAATDAADAAAISGSVAASAPTGALAATEASDVAAFVGTVGLTGALAATDAADAVAMSGTATAPVSGTLAATDGADAAAMAGSVNGGATGTLAATENPDAAAFAGSVASGSVSADQTTTKADATTPTADHT